MSLTISAWSRIKLGNKILAATKVYGDGSTTTIVAPLGKVEYAWLQAIDDTSMPLVASISGATVTYSGTGPSSGKYHWIFCIGWD